MIIYCLKCKHKTETIDYLEMKSSNGRDMIKGICSICGTKKSVFVSLTTTAAPQALTATAAKQASKYREFVEKGFDLNNLINNLPIEFHQYAEKGEYVPGWFVQRSTEIFVLWSRYPIRAENQGGIQGYQRVG